MGPNGPVALDFSSILMTTQMQGRDAALMADVLPLVEPVIINSFYDDKETHTDAGTDAEFGNATDG